MSEKTNVNENSAVKKERFEVVLTKNGDIVCQRYFRMFGFKPQSFSSLELVDTFESIIRLIDEDLKTKSIDYLRYTAPQVYANREEMESHVYSLPVDLMEYVLLADTKEVFTWDGEVLKPYNGHFNTNDYVLSEEQEVQPCVLKFTLYDNGFDLNSHVEVISKVWDGNVYPRFVRNNIDLSNKNNKYKTEAFFSIYDAVLVDQLNDGHKDLIPIIVGDICDCCSGDNKKFTRTFECGGKEYGLNLFTLNERYEKSVADYYQKKTTEYFRN